MEILPQAAATAGPCSDRNTVTRAILVCDRWLIRGEACCRSHSVGFRSQPHIDRCPSACSLPSGSAGVSPARSWDAEERAGRPRSQGLGWGGRAPEQTGGITMNETKLTAAVVGFTMMLAANVPAGAAEIKVTSSNALKTTLEQLAPAFEKATEHKLAFTWGAAVPLKAEIEKGATFDLAVLTTAAIDDLIGQGKLVAATRAALANSGAGVAVRKGA